ncbi:MAG: 2-oxoacid:acceptor oxidoreductase family protein [Planctomycetota bacterium]|jgi:2-oxoglutarate ferredoxin oxidoreductase subunit gamma
MKTFAVRLAGSGGQGLILAGAILAEAGAVHEGFHVVQTDSYGPEARGGASKSDVILSREEILAPKPKMVDYMICLSQESYDKYRSTLREGGKLILDSGLVKPDPSDEAAIGVAITELTVEKTGMKLPANVTALGVFQGALGIVAEESLAQAVAGRVPAKAKEKNLDAFRAGVAHGKAAVGR